jgi:hypothetical protein
MISIGQWPPRPSWPGLIRAAEQKLEQQNFWTCSSCCLRSMGARASHFTTLCTRAPFPPSRRGWIARGRSWPTRAAQQTMAVLVQCTVVPPQYSSNSRGNRTLLLGQLRHRCVERSVRPSYLRSCKRHQARSNQIPALSLTFMVPKHGAPLIIADPPPLALANMQPSANRSVSHQPPSEAPKTASNDCHLLLCVWADSGDNVACGRGPWNWWTGTMDDGRWTMDDGRFQQGMG